MSATTIECCRILPDGWDTSVPVRIGDLSRPYTSPDFYVTAERANEDRVRIDAYLGQDAPDCFREAILWERWVAVGLGAKACLIKLPSRDVVSIDLNAYFSSFHATRDFLLIASAEQIFRVDPNGTLRWSSRRIGIDGMIVSKVEAGRVFVQAEEDPPGGWQPYLLDASSGVVV